MVRALDWHGAVDFDFLRDATGQYLLLELNPRFSGTINFACKMGVDLPGAYLDLAFDNLKQSYQRDYAEGICFERSFPLRSSTGTGLAGSLGRRSCGAPSNFRCGRISTGATRPCCCANCVKPDG